MIEVTRLNGTPMILNADLIESIEATPDTLVCLTTGRKVILRDPVDEIVRLSLEYRNRIRSYGIPVGIPAAEAK